MKEIDPKQMVTILRVLRDAGEAVGSAEIARELQAYGIDLSSRTIRLYLQDMEMNGLVGSASRGRKGGRTITPKGIEEIKDALVMERVGFTAAKVDALSCEMTFYPARGTGLIVLNVSMVDEVHLSQALNEMLPVFEAGLSMGEYLLVARAGDQVGDSEVPPGRVWIGTVCSVTLNGVLLNARIPTVSRFGGVLEMDQGRPMRFTDVIYYDGTSLDPLEIFIKGGLTSVRQTVQTGRGRIGASFREVPTAALSETKRIRRRMEQLGLGGILMIGKPNQPLLDFPVHEGRTGMIVTGGLNPAAAVEESGIPTTNHALHALFDFEKLVHYRRLTEQLVNPNREMVSGNPMSSMSSKRPSPD